MSTHAAFTVNSGKSVVHLYFHHDGYEAGAASYLYNALATKSKGGFAEALIRGNEEAEITPDPDNCGAEFFYRVNENMDLIVHHRNLNTGTKHLIFSGSVYEFINTHRQLLPDDFTQLLKIKIGYVNRWLNEPLAKKELESKYSCLDHLRMWKDNYVGGANWNHAAASLRQMLDVWPNLETEEMTEILALKK